MPLNSTLAATRLLCTQHTRLQRRRHVVVAILHIQAPICVLDVEDATNACHTRTHSARQLVNRVSALDSG